MVPLVSACKASHRAVSEMDPPCAMQKFEAAKQQKDFEAAQQQRQNDSNTVSGVAPKPSSKPAQAQASKSALPAAQPQQLQAAPKAAPEAPRGTTIAKPAPQARSSQSAVPGQPTQSTKAAAEAAPSPSLPTSAAPQAVKPLQLAKAASKPSPSQTQAQASLSKADAASAPSAERTSASQTQAKTSQAAAAATVPDEWADKGVPMQSGYLQSGYQMADSPSPEEEDLVSEYETSRPPSTERQQVDSARAELAASQAPAKAAATSKGVAPVPSVAPNTAQSPKVILQEKVLLPAGNDVAKAPSSSKSALPSSSETGKVSKQPPNRQSSSAAAAASRTAAPPARSTPPAAAKSPPTGEKGPLAAPSTGPSGSSASKQAQPAQPGNRKTLKSQGVHASSSSKAKQATQVPGSSAEGGPLATAPAQGMPASGKVPSSSELPAKHPSQQLSLPVSSQQRPSAPGKSAGQPKTAPAVAAERSTKSPLPSPQPPAATVKSSAPKQSSAALTGQAAAASPSSPPGNTPSPSRSQVQSSLALAASNAKPQAVQSAVVAPPASKSKASMRESIPTRLQASPQDPPIPGLSCLENPMTAPDVLPLTAAGPSCPVTAPGQPEQMVLQPLSSWVPPPPAEAPPQLPQVPSDPYPPEPSSPRPAPMARDPSKKRSRGAAEPGVGNGPTPPSDSGEDMEIDDEAAPPLPTEPFPQGFELATINSNQELVELSGEQRGSLLDELSGIHVRHHVLSLSSGLSRVICNFTVPHCNADTVLV